MQTFGNYLKEQREATKMSLKQVARLTHVTERYLDFIEKDAFDKVPEGPYIRGYICSYATAIGIDANKALERFDSICRETNKTEDMQKEASEMNLRQKTITFFLNNGKWLILCSTMLVLLTFGAYHFLSQDEKKAPVVANLQEPEGETPQPPLAVKSEENFPTLKMNTYAMASGEPEGLTRDPAHGDNKRVQEPASLEIASSPQTRAHQKSAGLPSLPSEKPGNTSKVPIKAAHSQDIPGVESPAPALTSGGRTGKDRSDHPKNIEVLNAAVCAGVTDRNPAGKDDSFQWSTDRVYIWNLIKCETHLSSIRHIYYFEGQKVTDIVLDIRSPLWRTWSSKALSDKRFIGHWRVDITSADGELLRRLQFEVI